MDALIPESSSHVFKSKRVIAATWRPTRQPVMATTMVLAGLMMTAGCKTGNPLEHAVRVTHQPGSSHLAETPRTRLTAQGKTEPSDAAVQGELENEHDQLATAEPLVTSMKTSAQGSPNDNSKNSARDASQAALDDEYEELMSAFQDSPPEVQQQARRQLLAVSARKAARTQSPAGISKALKSSMKDLPVLSEEWPEPEQYPVRLASGTDEQDTESQTSLAILEQPIEGEEAESEGAEQAESQVDEASENTDVTSSPSTEPTQPTIQQVAHQSATAKANASPRKSSAESRKSVADDEFTEPQTDALDVTSLSDKELYAELIRRQQTAVAGESDADRYRREIIGRHLTLFSGDPDAAVAPIDEMSDAEQEFLRHQMLGLWTMIDQSGHPVATRRWSAAVPEFRQAMKNLANTSESLEVNSLAFCSEIQSFGQVTKFPTSQFAPGQKVILYCEIDNFVSESTTDGYQTQLQGSYEVFDSKGQKVAGQVLPADTQTSATALRDYFIAYQMGLPAGLSAGKYQLTLTMECQKGKKYGRATIPFEIK